MTGESPFYVLLMGVWGREGGREGGRKGGGGIKGLTLVAVCCLIKILSVLFSP